MAKNNVVQYIVVALCVGGLLSIVLLYDDSIRFSKVEQQCTYRLHRLGRAVQFWVADHGRQNFPPISNPSPRTLWEPGRAFSAAEVLQDYLSGSNESFRPQRIKEGESVAAYQTRLRDRELTCCPKSGFEFWYNADQLGQINPSRFVLNTEEDYGHDFYRKDAKTINEDVPRLVYFSSQNLENGNAPYEKNGHRGRYLVRGYAALRQVLKKHVDDLTKQLNEIEIKNSGKPQEQWTHDLFYLREQVGRYQKQLTRYPDGFAVARLETEVVFEADDPHVIIED